MIILNPVFNIVQIALNLYLWAIILSAIMSWLIHFGVINTSNQFISMVGEFLWRITEPALRPIRRFMPNLGGIDISPIVLILAIYFLRDLLGQFQYALNTGGL